MGANMKRSILLIFSVVLCGAIFILGGRLILCHNLTPDIKDIGRGNPLDPKNLPIGDGKLAQTPTKGYLMPCGQGPGGRGGGAFRDGSWIHHGGDWGWASKPLV